MPITPDHDPENIQQGVGIVTFECRAPRQHDGVNGIEDPDEQERAGFTPASSPA